ncbi:hypothetical protein Cgig2_022407 [Carnegiea gigantea]|uniref:R13L1/DRL21-like LRR repeat region domain-containing protein n=1 Tax=Carnegiea gigantea TaxID=171969 RepID=A0A9Q1KGN0_9CARY|nr:hypothetical protein Cgig2_022407 [Carnegiea gigantea]
MVIGETVLGVVLEVVLDRLASQQMINLLRSLKVDLSLLDKLKTMKSLMSAVTKLLSDAEQLTGPPWDFLGHLTLEFNNTDNHNSLKARAMLENLKPDVNLWKLTIRNYVETSFPTWLDGLHPIYTNITFLCLSGCRYSGCRYCIPLPPLGQLPSLLKVEIVGMEMDHIKAVAYLEGLVPVTWKVECFLHLVFNNFSCATTPSLEGHLPIHLPSLNVLMTWRCEQLAYSFLQYLTSQHWEIALHLTPITTSRFNKLVPLVYPPPELDRLS